MYPFDVAVSPDGSRIYVMSSNATNSDSIAVISALTNSVITTVLVPSGTVSSLALNPNGSKLYLSLSDMNSVLEMNTSTNSLSGDPIVVGNRPVDLAVSPDGKHIYVSNSDSDSISVIRAADRSVIATISGTGLFSPSDLRVTPDGSRLVALGHFGWIALIDTSSMSVIDSTYLGPAFHTALAISPDGSFGYFGHTPFDPETFDVISDEIRILSIDNFLAQDSIPISPGGVPSGYGVHFTAIAFTPDGERAYVSMQNKNRVGIIDTASSVIVDELPGLQPSVYGQFIVPANSFTGLIFNDGFESGSLVAWTSSSP